MIEIQLTPARTDFKGPIIFIFYRRISVIANIENKEKLSKRPRNSLFLTDFRYWRARYSRIQLYLYFYLGLTILVSSLSLFFYHRSSSALTPIVCPPTQFLPSTVFSIQPLSLSNLINLFFTSENACGDLQRSSRSFAAALRQTPKRKASSFRLIFVRKYSL